MSCRLYRKVCYNILNNLTIFTMTTPKSPENHSSENTFCNYILIFFVCALIGWLWEVVLFLFKTGGFVNRGVLHGPWLPIYGCGGLGIVLLLRRFKKHPAVVFFVAALGCGLLEYFTGWYLETFKHLRWWDYSAEFLNLHGRICLGSVTAFGLCGLAMIYLLYPNLIKLFNLLKLRPKKILCFALVVFFCADFIYSSDVPNTGEGITNEITHLQTAE